MISGIFFAPEGFLLVYFVIVKNNNKSVPLFILYPIQEKISFCNPPVCLPGGKELWIIFFLKVFIVVVILAFTLVHSSSDEAALLILMNPDALTN